MDELLSLGRKLLDAVAYVVASPAAPAVVSGCIGHLVLDALTALVALDKRLVRFLAFFITLVFYGGWSALYATSNLDGANALYGFLGGFVAISWDQLETWLERRKTKAPPAVVPPAEPGA